MGLTQTDLTAIKEVVFTIVHEEVGASEKRMKAHISTEIAESEKRTDEKFEKLTLQIGQGFNEVSERFDDVYTKFDEIHGRLDGIDTRLDSIDTRFGRLEDKTDGIKRILTAEVKRSDHHEVAITKIRKQLHAA